MSKARLAAVSISILMVVSACSGILDEEILLGDPALQGAGQQDEGSALAPPPSAEEPSESEATCPSASDLGWNGCTSACPCDEGQGDCDRDNHCLPGLICRHNVGASYGVAETVDVCERPDTEPAGQGDDSPAASAGTAAEGDSCEQASCGAGLACISVYSSSAGSVIGRHCLELCQSLGADSACEGGESCVLAASGEQVCFNPHSPSTGYASADGDAESPPEATPPEGTGLCGMNAQEQGVFELLNAERAAQGLGALQCDEAGVRAARDHSQDMCDRGYFSHTSPEGTQPWDRLRAAGAHFGAAGENIAMGQPSPQAVHNSWMNSSGHRANMLNGSWTRVGIGYVLCGQYSPYWTEVFMQ